MNHPVLKSCKECGCDHVDYPGISDGICVEFYCSECGSWVGELLESAEP